MAGAHEDLLGRAGQKTRAAYRALYGPDPEPVQKERAPRQRTESLPDDPLDGVTFASAAARKAAEKAGLSWAEFAFAEQGASSDRGWTKGDVEAIAAAEAEEG